MINPPTYNMAQLVGIFINSRTGSLPRSTARAMGAGVRMSRRCHVAILTVLSVYSPKSVAEILHLDSP